MANLFKQFDLKEINYSIFAVFGTSFFILGTIISMYLYPNYDLRTKYLSHLGMNERTSLIFNFTLMSTAIIYLPVIIATLVHTKSFMEQNSHRYVKIATLASLNGIIFLFLVGYIPGGGKTKDIHAFIAGVFYISIIIAIILYSTAILQFLKFHQLNQYIRGWDYFGFVFIPILLIYADRNSWYHRLMQKFVAFLALIYLTYLVIRISHLPKILQNKQYNQSESTE